jgi:hypothetical protein
MRVRDREDLNENEPFRLPSKAVSKQGPPTEQRLLYYGTARMSVRGPVTGTLYQFSRQQPIQTVDPRDAVSMLKTRLFRRIR